MMDGGKQKSLGRGGDQDWCQVIICNLVENDSLDQLRKILCGITTCSCR